MQKERYRTRKMMNYEERSRAQAEELKNRETVRILALETSCDETAAAVIENGRKILGEGNGN